MRETWEFVLAGAGGQGLVLAGTLLGEAALHDGLNAAQTQSYGIAARGGLTRSEVIISCGEIPYPHVTRPDVVVALSEGAARIYAAGLPAAALLLYDSEACGEGIISCSGGRAVGVPFCRLAREAGSPGAANVVALGAVVAATGAVSGKAVRRALEGRFEGDVLAANLRALELGLRAVAERLPSPAVD